MTQPADSHPPPTASPSPRSPSDAGAAHPVDAPHHNPPDASAAHPDASAPPPVDPSDAGAPPPVDPPDASASPSTPPPVDPALPSRSPYERSFRRARPRGFESPEQSLIRPGADWQVHDRSYGDISYATSEGVAKLTICRAASRNAFRPQTLFELSDAMSSARDDDRIGAVIICGAGDLAFCSGGDQRIRGNDGYIGSDEVARKGIGRLNVLDLQIQIRRTPKPVVAMVAGYAIGGGHVLHLVCDLTIAADNAVFGQTGPRVGSFDGGYGSGLMARIVGQKKAREIWYLCAQYDASEALDMGLVNAVVPLEELEQETMRWCRRMLEHSPLALRMLKASMNAADDGLAGIQQLSGDATLLYYLSEEAQHGRDSYVKKTPPDFSQFPRRP